jgi:hypothetical protein
MCNVTILSFALLYKAKQVNAYEDHKNQVQYDSELAVVAVKRVTTRDCQILSSHPFYKLQKQ